VLCRGYVCLAAGLIRTKRQQPYRQTLRVHARRNADLPVQQAVKLDLVINLRPRRRSESMCRSDYLHELIE
jgi:hypothetical protein